VPGQDDADFDELCGNSRAETLPTYQVITPAAGAVFEEWS
jgi:hypothetical protein